MCVECDLAEPESLASLGGSAPGLVDGILSPVTVHFLEDLERILTSDPASPPLAPLSTSEPCLACEAWATW